MSRTPEETARLAATVTVETIYGDVGISAKVAMGAARARFHGSDHPRLHALACLAADLAEARAEVAALREDRDRFAMFRCVEMAGALVTALGINPPCEDAVAEWRKVCDVAEQMAEAARLLAEWQAAKRAEEQLLRLQTTAEFGELATARSAWEAAAVAREAIEARMLAADLGEEVGRG